MLYVRSVESDRNEAPSSRSRVLEDQDDLDL